MFLTLHCIARKLPTRGVLRPSEAVSVLANTSWWFFAISVLFLLPPAVLVALIYAYPTVIEAFALSPPSLLAAAIVSVYAYSLILLLSLGK